MGGGKQHKARQKLARKTWLNPDIDWGVSYRAYVFTNREVDADDGDDEAEPEEEKQPVASYESSVMRRFPGEVLHECASSGIFGDMTKCCLRAKQLSFMVDIAATWRDMEWVALIDDNSYLVPPLVLRSSYSEPVVLGHDRCAGVTCRGMCGGSGVFLNRAAVELFGAAALAGAGNFEQVMVDACNHCGGWADLTLSKIIRDLNRLSVEKHLFLASGKHYNHNVSYQGLAKNPLAMFAKETIRPLALTTSFYPSVAANSTELKSRLFGPVDKTPAVWLSDFSENSHAVHQAMLSRFAVAFRGKSPPKTVAYFRSLSEEEAETPPVQQI